jgi:hypothetical protein
MRTPKPLEIVEVRPGVFMRLSASAAAKFAKPSETKKATKPQNKKAKVDADKAVESDEEAEA